MLRKKKRSLRLRKSPKKRSPRWTMLCFQRNSSPLLCCIIYIALHVQSPDINCMYTQSCYTAQKFLHFLRPTKSPMDGGVLPWGLEVRPPKRPRLWDLALFTKSVPRSRLREETGPHKAETWKLLPVFLLYVFLRSKTLTTAWGKS